MTQHTQKTTARNWARVSLVAIAGMLLPVAAMAGPARADEPSANVCITSIDDEGWDVTRCSGSPNEAVVSRTWTLASFNAAQIVEKSCDDFNGTTYRLTNTDLSPGRAVPRGVQILEPGGVGATGLIHRDDQGYGDGVAALALANWALENRTVQVLLHCTSDSTLWYR